MLSRFDWLTPPITLYYNEGLQHSSIASVIISIIGYLSSVIIGLYLSVDFFKRKNPTVFILTDMSKIQVYMLLIQKEYFIISNLSIQLMQYQDQ